MTPHIQNAFSKTYTDKDGVQHIVDVTVFRKTSEAFTEVNVIVKFGNKHWNDNVPLVTLEGDELAEVQKQFEKADLAAAICIFKRLFRKSLFQEELKSMQK